MSRPFGWDYPPGSMRGSGIYETTEEHRLQCPDCEVEDDVEVNIDDWGRGEWECGSCGAVHTWEPEVPEREPDDYWED